MEKFIIGCGEHAEYGMHQYATETCKCGHEFCFACCGKTNVACGGKYEADFMICPKCGHDILA